MSTYIVTGASKGGDHSMRIFGALLTTHSCNARTGIGLSTVKVLLECYKANVVAMSRTETQDLTALAEKYKGNLIIFQGDCSKPEDNKVFSSLLELCGKFNAGVTGSSQRRRSSVQ